MARAQKTERGLTPIQARFCEEYLVDLKAGKAALRAGYSAGSASCKASQLLAMQHVQAHLEFLQGQATMAASMQAGVSTAAQVLKEIDKGATVDPGLMFDSAGNFLPVPSMPEHVRRAIDKFTVQEVTRTESSGDGSTTTITTRTMACALSKTKDKEMMAKHHKLLVDRVELGVDEALAARMIASLARGG